MFDIFSNADLKAEVRVIMIGDTPWFIAKDVCDALGVRTDNLRAILDNDEIATLPGNLAIEANPYSIGVGSAGGRAPLIISEPGLYSAIIKARKPGAKAFKRWVTHEVLPSIRKTGMYGTDRIMQKLCNLEAMIKQQQGCTQPSQAPLATADRGKYHTVSRMSAELQDVGYDLRYAMVIGRTLTKMSHELGYDIKKFGSVKGYHIDVWNIFFNREDDFLKDYKVQY